MHDGRARAPQPVAISRALLRRAIAAAAIGNAMEWFDFGLYNYLAVTIGRVFFPGGDAASQQIAALGTFAAAFLVRPLGALFFGPLGDRIGRQRVLAATMVLMACGTAAIGLIPGTARIGIAAPCLLLAARLVQGFSTGGEYGGATTFIAEFAPHQQRGFWGSFLEVGTCAGFLLGAGCAALLTAWLSPAALDGWGWRLPFLLAAPLGLIGVYIRLHLEETPAFRAAAVRQAESPKHETAWQIARHHGRGLLLCMVLVVVFNIPDFLILSYMPSYLTTTLGLPESRSLIFSGIGLLAMMALVPCAGWLSDRVGRRVMIAGCSCAYLLLALPCFAVIRHGGAWPVLAGLLILCLPLAGLIGTMPGTLPALFPTTIRYGALAIAYNISISLFGSTSLPIVAWLIRRTGDALVPAYYLMGSSALGLMAALWMRETAGKVLPGAPEVVSLS